MHSNSTQPMSESHTHQLGSNERDSATDDSHSLTANDFEVLNSENFFDKVNDAYNAVSLPSTKPEKQTKKRRE